MYFIVTKRIHKINTGNTQKFQPRTANQTSVAINGPFTKKALAERAAANALKTFTCLSAVVVDFYHMKKMRDEHGTASYGDNILMYRELNKTIKLFQNQYDDSALEKVS